jgi:alkaline phosphatase D
MFPNRLFPLFSLLVLMISCLNPATEGEAVEGLVTKIAFGSCGWEGHPLPIFDVVVDHQPDLFVFLGDNIYGDTENMDTLRAKYERLGNKPTYQNLKNNVPIIATWDDHDFGWNDTGSSYPYKEESKEIFLDFFGEPASSARRDHPGIYHSYLYEYGENTLQVILLDGRTFRDDLKPYGGEFDDDRRYSFYGNDYAPHTDSTVVFLGEAQWEWLEKELRVPADIRIIGSGTQFGIEWNGYEAWANFPHEQQRMLDLIKQTKASGVMFISGDVHYSEISRLETDFYPIYDFTSSGLSSTWLFATPNNNRIEGPVMDNHFGLITIFWDQENTEIMMETWDVTDNQRIEYTIPLKSIQFEEY